MSIPRDKLVAASLAVRRGLITMDQALAVIQDPNADLASFLLSIKDNNGNGDMANMAETIAATRTMMANPQNAGDHLITLGLDPVARVELEQVIKGKPVEVEETLLKIASSDKVHKTEPLGTSDFTPGGSTPATVRLARNPTSLIDPKRYTIKQEFARGGMGRILLARDNVVGRDIAIKELLPEFRPTGSTRVSAPEPGHSSSSTTAATERFLREAKVTGQLEHPNIVPVYEIGHYADGTSYYTMKFVRGETMYARLKRIQNDPTFTREKRFAERIKLLDAFVDVCHAVAFAHSKGVIHRDLKPHNIMLGDFGDTVLLDWGIARIQGIDDTAGKRMAAKGTMAISDSLRDTDSAQLTMEGSVFGTPHYMPPEQARGDVAAVDEQSDVYALGAILFEILTGAPPYEAPKAAMIIQMVLAGPPVPASEREPLAPPELVALCKRALASSKAERIKTALIMAKEVQAFRDGRALSVYQYSSLELVRRFVNRNKVPVGIALVAILLLITGGIYAYTDIRRQRNAAEDSAKKAKDALLIAQSALDEADKERRDKEALRKQQEEADRARFNMRKDEIRQRKQTLENMRIEPTLQEMNRKLAVYDDRSSGRTVFEIPAADHDDNRKMLSSLLGYLSAQKSLLELINVPIEQRDLLGDLDLNLEDEALRLDNACFAAARLAAYNGDFALASLLLNESHDKGERHDVETARVSKTRGALLEGQSLAIQNALRDVRLDVRRADRPKGSPDLVAYTALLSNFRDSQTVKLLGNALSLYVARSRNNVKRFTIAEKDEVKLICGVLSRLELAHETVPVLVEFMNVVLDPELLVATVNGLSRTRSAQAFEPVASLLTYRFNYVWTSTCQEFAQLPISGAAANPDNAKSFLLRSVARRARGDNDGAIADCSAGMRLDSANTLLPINRGFARGAKGDYDGAVDDFTLALRIDKNHARAYVARGDAYTRKGEFEAAFADYGQSALLDPQNPTPLIQRGLARRENSDLAGAVEDLTAAIKLQDDRSEPYLQRGQCYEGLGNTEAAIADYNKAIELAPDDAEGWRLVGILHRHKAENGTADKELTEAILRNSRDARSYSWRAQARYGIGNLVGAVNDCTRAVELDPLDWMAYYYRGITYLAIGGNDEQVSHQRKQAAGDFVEALRINPRDFRCWWLLGTTQEAAGDFEGARSAYASALKVNSLGSYALAQVPPREIDRAIARVNGHRLLGRDPATPPEHWLKALAHASRALPEDANESRQPPDERDIADLRIAIQLIAKAQDDIAALPDSDWRTRQLAYDAALVTAQALQARSFVTDARDVYRALLDRFTPAATTDPYNAACACARIARQLEAGAVMRLGKDNADRQAKEQEAHISDSALLSKACTRENNAALDFLEMAVAAGFDAAETAERDADLEALRSNDRFKALVRRMRENKSNPEKSALAGGIRPVLTIGSVLPGKQAEKLGIRPDDVIYSANGKRIFNFDGLRAAMADVAPGATFRMVIRRYSFDADRHLIAQLDDNGKYVRDAAGQPQWKFEEVVVEPRRGLLGITLGTGELAAPPTLR
ncbi:MAG: tetratricopeptide repeat protein [Planctomycetes bacterium]|nr:tetratricopeptide repeat protein [Planctomycetota bacterium]